jgi:hypothetical protein
MSQLRRRIRGSLGERPKPRAERPLEGGRNHSCRKIAPGRNSLGRLMINNTNAETGNHYLEIDQFETGTDRHSHSKQNGERMMADLNRSTTAALFPCGAAAPKNDRSLFQIFRRRLQFAARYFEAKKRSKLIEKLLPILERSFEHPWVIAVELQIRFWPGNETKLGVPVQSMHWDAPIAVSVFRERRGKKRQELCMSIYVVKDVLYIRQIQGVPGTAAPKELRDWPKIFIESCRTFAREEGLKEVRVPKAETLYSYRNPYINPQLNPASRERALMRIRQNMQLLYDANAQQLGFVSDAAWYKWQCLMAAA